MPCAPERTARALTRRSDPCTRLKLTTKSSEVIPGNARERPGKFSGKTTVYPESPGVFASRNFPGVASAGGRGAPYRSSWRAAQRSGTARGGARLREGHATHVVPDVLMRPIKHVGDERLPVDLRPDRAGRRACCSGLLRRLVSPALRGGRGLALEAPHRHSPPPPRRRPALFAAATAIAAAAGAPAGARAPGLVWRSRAPVQAAHASTRGEHETRGSAAPRQISSIEGSSLPSVSARGDVPHIFLEDADARRNTTSRHEMPAGVVGWRATARPRPPMRAHARSGNRHQPACGMWTALNRSTYCKWR